MAKLRKNELNTPKKILQVLQKKEKLIIEGVYSSTEGNVIDLVLINHLDGSEVYRHSNQGEGDNFLFEININVLFQLPNLVEGVQLNWFIEVKTKRESEITPLRLGKFFETKLEKLQFRDENLNCLISYVTPLGNLSLIYNHEPGVNAATHIERFKESKRRISVSGYLNTAHFQIESGEVFLKGRRNDSEISFPVKFDRNKAENIKKFGMNTYTYQFELDFEGIYLKEDVYDTYFRLKEEGSEADVLVRVGNPRIKARYKLRESHSKTSDFVSVVTPYYTFKRLNLSFEVFELKKDVFLYLQQQYKFSKLKFWMNKKKDIWLVGELPYKAQDTGYHFFKYMRENFPEKKVYYVIDKSSPEFKNVEPLGNVLEFKSKAHVKYSLLATKIVSSHHADYLFPLKTKKFQKKINGVKVFLQHGVMGMKNVVANYGKKTSTFDTDAFIVSSAIEKELIITDFGYDDKEVFITGLSRFDSLLKNDVKLEKQILIIPTWRDWITTRERFLESEYYEKYKELVYHPKLLQLSKEYGFSIILCLHPNMQQFSNEFSHAPIKVITQGEVDVQLLLKQSALLITDYSSVAWDFSFLHRPVLYYQFDRNKTFEKTPPHIDLDEDLPGDVAFSVDHLLEQLDYYCHNQFTMKEANKLKAERFLTYRDLKSSERIYHVVKNLKRSPASLKNILSHHWITDLFRKFRRSSVYFPVMKGMYRVLKFLMPVNKNLILFESGFGTQYSDSPRYVYEEIVKREFPYKKIWVYNGNIRFRDENTKVIKRLSPQYYYYLAKAGYWVNNQNFPTYMSKRKQTTYLQTWHGTPLKKMLFDIENIHGRDEGYLTRVHQATQTWDYLISPNEYATKAFKSAFKYNKEVLEVGYPRNDIFYQEERAKVYKQTKRKFNIPLDKKIILYAPTFRDHETKGYGKFQFKLNLDLHEMKQHFGEEYVILLRQHVVIKERFNIDAELADFVINVSNYSEIRDLYLISDILMTDYSSVFFDFANTSKPILFFTYDLDVYKNEIRGFYMDFENEAPGPLLKTTEEVIDAIVNIHKVEQEYSEKYRRFKERFCYLEDGGAAQRVVDEIF